MGVVADCGEHHEVQVGLTQQNVHGWAGPWQTHPPLQRGSRMQRGLPSPSRLTQHEGELVVGVRADPQLPHLHLCGGRGKG